MTTPQPSYNDLVSSALHSIMAVLNNASEADLQTFLNDDTKLDTLIAETTQRKGLEVEREMLLAQNKSLAEWNLSQEPKLKSGKQRLVDAYERTQAVQTEVNTLKAQLDSLSTARSLDTTLALLQAAAQEADDKSEKSAEQFVRGTIGVTEFIENFVPDRQLAHSRKVRAEKLADTLRQQRAAYGQGAAHRHAPLPPPVPAPYGTMPLAGAVPAMPVPAQQAYWGQPPPHSTGGASYPQLPGFR